MAFVKNSSVALSDCFFIGTGKGGEQPLPFLNHTRTGLRPARAWFLEIVSSANIGVCVCVCPHPRGH